MFYVSADGRSLESFDNAHDAVKFASTIMYCSESTRERLLIDLETNGKACFGYGFRGVDISASLSN